MIDIEKIADSIRPKETVIKLMNNPVKDDQLPYFQEEPYCKQIFLARDIKALAQRKEYLLSVIGQENEKDNTPQYIEPIRIISNGKQIIGPGQGLPEKLRLLPNKMLIDQCNTEIKQVTDLLRIEQILNEYKAIQGENEKLHYLLHAREGTTKNEYRPPQYYTEAEFAQIIVTAASMIKETRTEVAQPPVPDLATPAIPTRAIALYFYYAALSGGQPVRKNNARQLAERFGKTSPNSGPDLYNHYLALQRDKKEGVEISGNANNAKARLHNLKTAVELLRTDNNAAAVKIALEELDELKNAYDKRY